MAQGRVQYHALGFTLIELVAGIIVFSIVVTVVALLVAPQATRSVQPIFQVRATELAQGLFNEITAKAFDENSDFSGGTIRCDELNSDFPIGFTAPNCTEPNDLGAEEANRADFDDIDDYNDLVIGDDEVITNSLNQPIVDGITGQNIYDGFVVSISVFYDNDFNGLPDSGRSHRKAIQITVTPPNNTPLVFTTYKSNF